jgi:hypothetical protein
MGGGGDMNPGGKGDPRNIDFTVSRVWTLSVERHGLLCFARGGGGDICVVRIFNLHTCGY